MKKTDYDYMSEPTRVKRVVQGFTEMTLHDFRTMQLKDRRFADFFSSVIIETENLSEKAEHMKYTDIICLIENMTGNEAYGGDMNGDPYTGDELQLFHYKSIQNLLLDVFTRCIPIRLFLALPVKAFYKCLWDISGRNILAIEYRSVRKLYTKLGGKEREDEITIKDVLDQCAAIYRKPWSIPFNSLERYKEDMLYAYNLTGKLLVKSFKEAFPEKFCVEEVRSKYSDSPEEIGIPSVQDEEMNVPDGGEELPFN